MVNVVPPPRVRISVPPVAGHHADELQPEGPCVAKIDALGSRYLCHLMSDQFGCGPQRDVNVPERPSGKAYLRALVTSSFRMRLQGRRYRRRRQSHRAPCQADAGDLSHMGLEEVRSQALDVVSEIEVREVASAGEAFMNKSHGFHAVLGVRKEGDILRVFEVVELEVEKTGDDLEVVLDTVVDFLEEDLFVVERGLELFRLLVLGDIHGDVHRPEVPASSCTGLA